MSRKVSELPSSEADESSRHRETDEGDDLPNGKVETHRVSEEDPGVSEHRTLKRNTTETENTAAPKSPSILYHKLLKSDDTDTTESSTSQQNTDLEHNSTLIKNIDTETIKSPTFQHVSAEESRRLELSDSTDTVDILQGVTQPRETESDVSTSRGLLQTESEVDAVSPYTPSYLSHDVEPEIDQTPTPKSLTQEIRTESEVVTDPPVIPDCFSQETEPESPTDRSQDHKIKTESEVVTDFPTALQDISLGSNADSLNLSGQFPTSQTAEYAMKETLKEDSPTGDNEETVPLNSSVDGGTPVDQPPERVVAPTAEGETISESDLCDDDTEPRTPGETPTREPPTQPLPASDPQKEPLNERESTIVEVIDYPGKDETDALSMYSLYMESDFRYYLQHPYARLFIAYFVTFCNFLIYAEDPVAHSRAECNIPVIGNSFAFIFTRYPPNAWSFLKVLLWFSAIIIGMIVGKMLFHTFLFNKLFRLKMFSDDKGSWMTMFLCTLLCVFIMSNIYNAFLMIGGDATSEYHISPYMSIANHIFMKAAATGTWCGDFFTAWMVTDMMLQEKLYPMWANKPRQWWNAGYHRIVLFWVIVLVTSFVVVFVIATDYINWDSLNRDFLHTNELSRAFLASFILVMDMIIVMQDWDFPHFIGAIDIKLPGINVAHIRFKIPRLLKKLEYWHVHISGKWFNYGILFIVILLDLNMWKNQIFYSPLEYGQYVDTEGRIHSVNDEFSINNGTDAIISFAFRNTTIDPITGKRYIELDNIMNARYYEYSMGVKSIAFIPSIAGFITFGVLVWIYGRMPKPTKNNPYAGRLKLRKKRRFSMRIGWKRLRKRFHSTPAVLTGFKDLEMEQNGGKGGTDGERDGKDKDLEMAGKVVELWKGSRDEIQNSEESNRRQRNEDEEEGNVDGKQALAMDVTDV